MLELLPSGRLASIVLWTGLGRLLIFALFRRSALITAAICGMLAMAAMIRMMAVVVIAVRPGPAGGDWQRDCDREDEKRFPHGLLQR